MLAPSPPEVAMNRFAALLLLVPLGCGVGPGAPAKKGAAPRQVRAGEAVALSDHVRVTFGRAAVLRLAGGRHGQSVSDVVLRVDYTVENTSAVKVVDWAGWQGRCGAADEHGNVLGSHSVADGFRFASDEEADAFDARTRMGPGAKAVRHLYFVRPPASSGTVRLELTARDALPGADGRLAVELPIRRQDAP
jgi:hypothetical protein